MFLLLIVGFGDNASPISKKVGNFIINNVLNARSVVKNDETTLTFTPNEFCDNFGLSEDKTRHRSGKLRSQFFLVHRNTTSYDTGRLKRVEISGKVYTKLSGLPGVVHYV